MSPQPATTVRLKVSPQVARLVEPGAPRAAQLAAARGTLPLAGKELLTVLLFLCASGDAEIRQAALETLRTLPEQSLQPVLEDAALHPRLLDLLVRSRLESRGLMQAVIVHPATPVASLLYLARKGGLPVLRCLANQPGCLARNPELVAALSANPHADRELLLQLDREAAEQPSPAALSKTGREQADEETSDEDLARMEFEDVDVAGLLQAADRDGASKYQIALDLGVVDKIKIALTGDKEWRSILIKDANKLVQGAVIKNPRITEGEVMAVAKNKTSSDELIRLILLNKEWLKNYEIRRALCSHPKTPLPKAIRFIAMLHHKDLKELTRSKQVSNILSTTARKELERREKRGGGH